VEENRETWKKEKHRSAARHQKKSFSLNIEYTLPQMG
jgi:hypothetical protein